MFFFVFLCFFCWFDFFPGLFGCYSLLLFLCVFLFLFFLGTLEFSVFLSRCFPDFFLVIFSVGIANSLKDIESKSCKQYTVMSLSPKSTSLHTSMDF